MKGRGEAHLSSRIDGEAASAEGEVTYGGVTPAGGRKIGEGGGEEGE